MNEGEAPVPAHDPPPRKSDRTTVVVVIVLALGLIALIALNMN